MHYIGAVSDMDATDAEVISESWELWQKWVICGIWKVWKMGYLRKLKSMTKWVSRGSWKVWQNELSVEAEKYDKMSYPWKLKSMTKWVICGRRKVCHYNAKNGYLTSGNHLVWPRILFPSDKKPFFSMKNLILALFRYRTFVLVGHFPSLILLSLFDPIYLLSR